MPSIPKREHKSDRNYASVAKVLVHSTHELNNKFTVIRYWVKTIGLLFKPVSIFPVFVIFNFTMSVTSNCD